MKKITCLLFFITSINASATEVITCKDAMSVGGEAKSALHHLAQQRAQLDIENFVEKPLIKPYLDVWGSSSYPAVMAELVEIYWCEAANTPLHEAYYRFYASNKHVFTH
ncbi:hypothetical protein [Shewanella sp. AC91-MNA-CIBAN-0169]|jgi:hypothetical protein|uniref:hypothetical protein n=1 Tax=Shewanella TaxID=22 RepID=UPI0033260C53